jgi:hypothetical protein
VGTKYTTSKELQGLGNGPEPKKALRAAVIQMKKFKKKAESRGFSVKFEEPYWYVGNGTGTSVEGRAYELEERLERDSGGSIKEKSGSIDRLLKMMEKTTTGKTLETVVLPAYLSKDDGESTKSYWGSIFYIRKLGPNGYEWWHSLHKGSKRAGIHIEMNTYLKERGDQEDFEHMLSGLCGS